MIRIAEGLYPPELAASWDNSGFLVGRLDAQVESILFSLDVTDAVIDEALSIGAQLIISHHPIIFKPISHITDTTPLGAKLLRLTENCIAAYAMHTNLDAGEGGTNDTLANALELDSVELMGEPPSMGRVGILKKAETLSTFGERVKQACGLRTIRVFGDPDSIVSRVGIVTGSGSNPALFSDAKRLGCDVYVTGDIKFHEAQEAHDMGLALVDATHYASEVIALEQLSKSLNEGFAREGFEIKTYISNVNGQVFVDI